MRPRFVNTSRRGWVAGAALTAVLTLSACGDASTDEALPQYDPTPVTVEETATEINRQAFRLPLQVSDTPVVDPGWQTPPQYADGVFLSADHTGDVLTFRAVDGTGTVQWKADRPLSCTGFTLTSHQDTSYAVLTDIDAEVQTFGATVASAYDLHTGEPVWGPIDVPGPHHGPGTVFAAPTDQAMGASGPKIVLDPASGQVVVDEREHDAKILGEFHGTILLVVADAVYAYHAADLADTGLDAEPIWTLDPDDFGWEVDHVLAHLPVALADPTGTSASPGVLLGTDDTDRALIDLTTAEVIAEELSDAGQDPTSQTWVTIGETLAGYSATGQQLYDEPHEDLTFQGVGAAMVYLENTAGDLEAHNVVTGKLGRAYDPEATGTLTVPTVIAADGAGVLEAEGTYYLATVPTVEQPDE